MSNHFTGLSLGPPLGDQKLDLCDLYAFQSPTDPSRTVIILNANPTADALHPDAIYQLNIDNDGDLLTDVALSYVFSKPQNGKQTFNVFLAKGAESRSAEAIGKKIVADAEVSFGPKPNLVKAGDYTFFAGSRSDAFFFCVLSEGGRPPAVDAREARNSAGRCRRRATAHGAPNARSSPSIGSTGRVFTDDVIDYRLAFRRSQTLPDADVTQRSSRNSNPSTLMSGPKAHVALVPMLYLFIAQPQSNRVHEK